MRFFVPCFALLAASVVCLSAIAQSPDKDKKNDAKATQTEKSATQAKDKNKNEEKGSENDESTRDQRRAEVFRERMLKQFDINKDGKLDEQERARAREKIREMRAAHQKEHEQPRPDGKKADHGPKHARDSRHRAEARRGPQPPNPEELFAKFDKDKDGKLSKVEFMALVKSVHEQMQHMARAGGPPMGPGIEGRRHAGPPRNAQFGHRGFGGPPFGPRFAERGFERGPARRWFERERFAGPGRYGFERGRFAGGPHRRRWNARSRFAGPPPWWQRERARFAGPHRHRRHGRPAAHHRKRRRRRNFEGNQFAGPRDGRQFERERFERRPERDGFERDRFADRPGGAEHGGRDYDRPRFFMERFEGSRDPRFGDERFDGPPPRGDRRDADRGEGHRHWRPDGPPDRDARESSANRKAMRRHGPPDGPPRLNDPPGNDGPPEARGHHPDHPPHPPTKDAPKPPGPSHAKPDHQAISPD